MTYKNDVERLLAGSGRLNEMVQTTRKTLSIMLGVLKQHIETLESSPTPFIKVDIGEKLQFGVRYFKKNLEVVLYNSGASTIKVLSPDVDVSMFLVPKVFAHLPDLLAHALECPGVGEELRFVISQTPKIDGETE